ncbi:MAG: Holliday junction branch migration protein RuvA [Gammaproteobacteria bacterium]|nr:Holliday junction branch migration protein RuvA [Gammaproteobacteria bacterium]
MIGLIQGKLIEKKPPWLVVDVGGIGYEVQVPMSTFYQLPEIDHAVKLYTHFAVREDAQTLYGFSDPHERQLFRSLIKVSGVGGRIALAILSGINVNSFIQSVENEDITRLVKVPGIGKKTAERLIVEMRDRLQDIPTSGDETGAKSTLADTEREAYDALVALGYREKEVSKMLASIDSSQNTEEIIRQALQKSAA